MVGGPGWGEAGSLQQGSEQRDSRGRPADAVWTQGPGKPAGGTLARFGPHGLLLTQTPASRDHGRPLAPPGWSRRRVRYCAPQWPGQILLLRCWVSCIQGVLGQAGRPVVPRGMSGLWGLAVICPHRCG